MSKGKVKKVPLNRMPLIDVPFKRVAVDFIDLVQATILVGPRLPLSQIISLCHNKVYKIKYNFITVLFVYSQSHPATIRTFNGTVQCKSKS